MNSDRRRQALRVGACLSLSGKYARFGGQAARALQLWQSTQGDVDLILLDDESNPHTLKENLHRVATQCDVLLGPYSTHLMRTAGQFAADEGWLVWNHGGSGDDVEVAHPGHVVSVLTPTSRYAEPFLHHLASGHEQATLWIVHGKGSFGRQVAEGAERIAAQLGIDTVRLGPDDELPSVDPTEPWHLFCAGSFENDVVTVKRAQALDNPPRTVCAVAAGVREFGEAVENHEGVFGVAQWFPGRARVVDLGPAEPDFLAAYSRLTGTTPDYPAVQALASGVLAAHCARRANGTTRDLLWSAATGLDTETLFGGFQIDPGSGAQVKHETTLVRWTAREPVAM